VLTVKGLLLRSQVCRFRDDVLEVSEQWRAATLSGGSDRLDVEVTWGELL
jgi:hypothetical protein